MSAGSPPDASTRSSASAEATDTSAPMIWPPSNATSIRTCSFSATGDDLREHAVHGVRVDERDLEPEKSLARLRVDQLGTLLGQPGERVADVGHLVGDV